MKRPVILFVVFIVLLLSVSLVSANLSGDRPASIMLQTKSYAQAGDKDLYDRANKLYQDKKYYKAHELFIESQYGNWEQMAKKCVRRWPKNGETWHDTTQWLRDTQVTFHVDQPKDSAIFIRVYKDDSPVSYVFIGGSDEVTVGLPGNGKYTFKDGVGSEWYDTTDTFGADGAYETMTFGQYEDDFIYMEARHEYTILINVEDAIGEEIGSSEETWENFTK
ncbi:MAG: hypothetical protein IJI57_05385 [Flexilinea sp.]|nr:hypothetical protein [Flexilinea sp.]